MKTEQITVKLAETSHLGRAGQVVTLALTPADVHDPTELPTYLAGFKPPEMRADEVSPVILTDNDEDKYRQFDADDAFLLLNVKGGIDAAIPEVQVTSSLTNYKVIDRFIGSFINDITDKNTGPNYRPRQVSMKRCSRAVLLDREVDCWTLLTTLGSWNAANRVTLAATYQWNGGTNSDPILDLHTRMEASEQEVTDIWFSRQGANAFLRHPSVRDHMRSLLGDAAPGATVAAINTKGGSRDFMIPGFPPFHVVPGKYRTTAGGTTSYILGADCVLTVSPPGVPTDGEEIATTYTFRRRGVAGVGYETREYRVEGRGPKGGTMVVASEASDIVITGSTCGGLIKSIIQ